MAINGGLGRRLTRAFFLQSAVIAIAAILGVQVRVHHRGRFNSAGARGRSGASWDLYDQDDSTLFPIRST